MDEGGIIPYTDLSHISWHLLRILVLYLRHLFKDHICFCYSGGKMIIKTVFSF